MLAAKFRFHGHAALRYVFGQGKTYRFKSFSMRVAHNNRRQHSRVAVMISKKVIKASPKRNTVRRRIYEVLRVLWPNIKPAQDIAISIYDPHFLDLSHEELVTEVQDALRTAHIWHETEVAQ